MNILKKFTLFLIAALIVSCVDIYDPKLTNSTQRLVVEGRITTELDYHWIFLTYDAGYNSQENNFTILVKNAKVWITDNAGNRYDFIDDQNQKSNLVTAIGFDYRSKDKFQAVVGRTYQLFIQTENGKQYRSKPETVREVPKLDKVYWEFRELPISFFTPRGEFLVYTDLQDSSTPNEYYKWEAIHWYQTSFCRYWVLRSDPPQFFKDRCCGDCYESSVCYDCSQIASDELVNGKELRKKFIARVPYDDVTPYYLAIKQFSISEEVHRFWNTVQQQAQNTGGLFDVTPKSVRGNMESVNNSEEEVLGIFSASDVSEKILYVNRNITKVKPFDPPSETYRTTNVCYPCLEAYNRSPNPPKGWVQLK